MIIKYSICPDADKCQVYRNWKNQTNENRLDVIASVGNGHECIALKVQLDYSRRRIAKSKYLEKRLKSANPSCLWIDLFNKR